MKNKVFICCDTQQQESSSWYVLNRRTSDLNFAETNFRSGCGFTSINSTLFSLGGFHLGVSSNSVFSFDFKHNTTTSLPDMIAPRINPLVLVFLNNFYVFGGNQTDSDTPWAEFYDHLTNKWSALVSPPQEIIHNAPYQGKFARKYNNTLFFWNQNLYCIYDLNDQTWDFSPVVRDILDFENSGFSSVTTTSSVLIGEDFFWYYNGDLFHYDLHETSRSHSPILSIRENTLLSHHVNHTTHLLALDDKKFAMFWTYNTDDGLSISWSKIRLKLEIKRPVKARFGSSKTLLLPQGIRVSHLLFQKEDTKQNDADGRVLFRDPWILLKLFRTMYIQSYMSYLRHSESSHQVDEMSVGEMTQALGIEEGWLPFLEKIIDKNALASLSLNKEELIALRHLLNN